MKPKFFVLLVVIFIATGAFSQADTRPMISVQGHSVMKVAPDQVYLTFNINSKGKLENEALTKLNDNSTKLVNKILAQGFTRDQLRISAFSLSEDYVYSENTNKKVGYIASQTIILKFPYNKEKLADIIGKLSTERSADVTLNFSTGLSDQLDKSSRNTLIEMAMGDAREKAEAIARAGKIRVISIQRADYAPQGSNVIYGYRNAEMKVTAGGNNFSAVDASEITLDESVNVTYLVESIK